MRGARVFDDGGIPEVDEGAEPAGVALALRGRRARWRASLREASRPEARQRLIALRFPATASLQQRGSLGLRLGESPTGITPD